MDTTTGSITGTPVANQSLTSYIVTGTYTIQPTSGTSSSSGVTRTIKIYVNSAGTITNLTCNTSGTFAGCTASLPFSCTSSGSCYSTASGCYGSTSVCIQ